MQPLIPFLVTISLASAGHLTLLPYAYLADPLPVYHQAQNTRTGEHAYSYSGGPSAKEEVKGPDGVTRGSYSYVDAHGILQSVFYVADEGGFRVAATNLPTSDDLPVEPVEIQLAKRALFDEQRKARSDTESHSRRRRSVDQSNSQNSNSEDQVAAESVNLPVFVNSVFLSKSPLATSSQSRIDVTSNLRLAPLAEVKLAAPVFQSYETLDAVALPVHVPLATSHQSRIQIHNSVRTEGLVEDKEKIEAIETPVVPLAAAVVKEYTPVLAAIPSFHENRLQIHRNLGLEGPVQQDAVKINTEAGAIIQPGLSPIAATILTKESSSADSASVSGSSEIASASAETEASAASTEESAEQSSEKSSEQSSEQSSGQSSEQSSEETSTIPAIPAIPTIPAIPAIPSIPAVPALPIASIPTAYSSQSRTQIHRNTKLELSAPVLSQPSVYFEPEPLTTFVQPLAYRAYLHSIPLAHSSQYRTQIHSSEKIEPVDATLIDGSNQETI